MPNEKPKKVKLEKKGNRVSVKPFADVSIFDKPNPTIKDVMNALKMIFERG